MLGKRFHLLKDRLVGFGKGLFPKLRESIDITFILAISLITALLLFSKVLHEAYFLTLQHEVPSGDDPASHIYIALKLAEDPSTIIFERVYNYTIVSFQYPNIIHCFTALLYYLTRNVLFLIEFIKIYSFLLIPLGLLLYTYIVYSILEGLGFTYRVSFALVFLALASILSRGILWTLSDGSIMELTAVLIILPLAILSLLRERYLVAGLLLVLSSLNVLGFIETIIVTTPWLFYLIMRKGLAPIKYIIVGSLLGGNIFLLRLVYKLAYVSYIVFTTKSTAAIGGHTLTISPINALTTVYGSIWLFYTYLAIYGFSILIFAYFRKYYSYEELLLASTLAIHSTLILLLPQILPYNIDALVRFARINLFLAALSTAFSIHIIFKPLIASKARITILLSNSHTFNYRFDLVLHRIGAIVALLVLISIIPLSHTISPILYKSLNTHEGLIRIDDDRLNLYLDLREQFIRSNETNIKILAVSQVSSWFRTLLTIPEKHIDVFLVATPEIYNTYSPQDPNRLVGLEIYNALVNGDLTKLKEYGFKYVAVELPNEGQWYNPGIRDFASHLWEEDFRPIAKLALLHYDPTSRYGLKLWMLKNAKYIELDNVYLKPGDVLVYHAYDAVFDKNSYIVLMDDNLEGNVTVISLIKPLNKNDMLYSMRKDYVYWLKFNNGEFQWCFVDRQWKTYILQLPAEAGRLYLVNATMLTQPSNTQLELTVTNMYGENLGRLLVNSTLVTVKSSETFIGGFLTAEGTIESNKGIVKIVAIYNHNCNESCKAVFDKTMLTPRVIELDEPYILFEPTILYMLLNNNNTKDLEMLNLLGIKSFEIHGNVSFTPSTPFMYLLSLNNANEKNDDYITLLGFPAGTSIELYNIEHKTKFIFFISDEIAKVKIPLPGTYKVRVYYDNTVNG